MSNNVAARREDPIMEKLRTRLRLLRLRRKMTPEMKARQASVEEAIRMAGSEGLAA